MSKEAQATVQLFKCPYCQQECYYLCAYCGHCAACCDCGTDTDPSMTQGAD